MFLTITLFVLFFTSLTHADCVFPERPELIEDLWSLDFTKICPDIGGKTVNGITNVIKNTNIRQINPMAVKDVVVSLVGELTGLKKSPLSCGRKILKAMCATNEFKMFRAALSTISVGASVGISFPVEVSASVSFNPAGLFDMVCVPGDNTEAVYNKIDQLNGTMLCALDKQTSELTTIANKNVERVLKGQSEHKEQLTLFHSAFTKTLSEKFGKAETLARTFHEEATANLKLLYGFMMDSCSTIKDLISEIDAMNTEIWFYRYVGQHLHNLRWAYHDLNVRKNNKTFQPTCDEFRPSNILNKLDYILEANMTDTIVKNNYYAQQGIINLISLYKTSMEQAQFFAKLCGSSNINDTEDAITRRSINITQQFPRLYKLWEDNFFSKDNIEHFVNDVLKSFVNYVGPNDKIALAIYKLLVENYGNSKYFFYVGVANNFRTLEPGIIDGLSVSECYVITSLNPDKTIYIMRNVKAEKYVDCSYFDQYSADYPNVFSQEAVAIQYHKNLCPGKQLIVHGGLDYAGEHDYGFNTFAIPYYDDQKQINYVNVIQHLSICDKYCVL